MRSIIKATALFFTATIVINYILPYTFGQRAVVYCSDMLYAQGGQYCQKTSILYGNVQLALQFVGIFISTVIFATFLEKKHTLRKQILSNISLLFGYTLSLGVIDILLFRPIIMMQAPLGFVYPQYPLNVPYISVIILYPFLLGIAVYVINFFHRRHMANNILNKPSS
jgi:hypothetical protein